MTKKNGILIIAAGVILAILTLLGSFYDLELSLKVYTGQEPQSNFFGILFVLFIIDRIAINVSNVHLAAFLNHISISARYGDFSRGIINTEAVIYYISVVSLFSFLTVHHIDKKRWI